MNKVYIGEKERTLQDLKKKASKEAERIKNLSQKHFITKELIRKLEEEPALPIKVFVAIEDHCAPGSNCVPNHDTHWFGIYYFPDTDMVKKYRDWSWGQGKIFDNEVNLSKFYRSGCDTLKTMLPYGEYFFESQKYYKLIHEGIVDVKNRIKYLLTENDNIADWELVGKLLLATYYKL